MSRSPSSSTATLVHEDATRSLRFGNEEIHEAVDERTTSPTDASEQSADNIFERTALPWEPRAWQRQAAQPFAPRNEAQKIWKRPPLKNITSENNATLRRWGTSADAMRPTKRLKLRQTAAGQENEESSLGPAYVATKWLPEQHEATRRKAGTTVSESSPEADVVPMVDAAQEVQASNTEETVDEKLSPEGSPVASPPQALEIGQSSDDKKERLDNARTSSVAEKSQPAIPLEVEFDLDPKGELAHAQAQDAHLQEAFTSISHNEEGASSLEAIADEIFALPGESDALSEQQSSNNKQISPATRPSTTQPLNPVQIDDEDTAYLHQFLQRAKEAREKNQSSTLCRPVGDRIKQHLIEQHNSNEGTDRKRPGSPEPEDVSDLEDEDPTITTTFAIPSIEENQEQNPSSPNRRSNRLTRLPRPHRPVALPSNISLRRLNGTEFISMAKQRTEAQSAALLLRNNTRKNKDGALTVRSRLAQMKQDTSESSDKAASSDIPSNSDSSQQQDQHKKQAAKRRKANTSNVRWAEQIAKFRDDDGEECPVLTDEEDEKLTAKDYMAKFMGDEEATETAQAPDDEDANSHPETDEVQQPPGSPSPRTRAKLAKATAKSQEIEKHISGIPKFDPKQKSDSNKRKRKQMQGSVNGTPGPAKRSAQMEELEDSAEAGPEDAQRQTLARPSTPANATRRIRMTRSSRGGSGTPAPMF